MLTILLKTIKYNDLLKEKNCLEKYSQTRNPSHVSYLSYEQTTVFLALKIVREFGLAISIGLIGI